jgi:FkbM family methyltransferase
MTSAAAPHDTTTHQAAVDAWAGGAHHEAYRLMGDYLRSRTGSEAFNDFAVMAASAGDRAAARAMLRAALVLDGSDADAVANLQAVDGSFTGALLRGLTEHWGVERALDYEDLLPPYMPPPFSDQEAAHVAGQLVALAPQIDAFYAGLDPRSRELLVRSLLNRGLGRRMAEPPLDPDEYRVVTERAHDLIVERDTARDGLCGSLDRFDLRPIGLPLEVHSHIVGIVTFFLLGQYRLRRGAATVMVEEGDVVIDGGACWGDTSVYFSHLAGPTGRVVAVEFDPANLAVLERNLALNRDIAERITVDQRALHGESGHDVGFNSAGYGTAIVEPQASADAVKTVTIDDLVEEHRLRRVDFIKLDIEGAEAFALLGAEKTLARFKPRLAIAAYHRHDDFVQLPKVISALAPGYRFYVDHYTLHPYETILYATPSQ